MLSGKTIFLLVAAVVTVAVFYFRTSQNVTRMGEVVQATELEEGFVTVNLNSGGGKVEIYFRKLEPIEKKTTKVDVLLLHGRKFSSKTWKDLKTINILGQNGHRTVAVDLLVLAILNHLQY